jgi:hypothetical protein
MAQLLPGGIQFTGTLNNLTAYKIRGSEKVYLRTKGGPTSQMVKESDQFSNVRRNNSEFGGRFAAIPSITPIIRPLKHIADHSWSSSLATLLKPTHELDTVSEWGKRNILLSLKPQLLQGYNLNRKFVLESIIRPGFSYTLDRNKMQAHIQLPALVPGDNLFIPPSFDWYRITAVLGIVPDHLYAEPEYQPADGLTDLPVASTQSTWMAAKEGSANIEWELNLPPVASSSFSLLLLAGISFGKVKGIDLIEPVKYVGGAKIIGMA